MRSLAFYSWWKRTVVTGTNTDWVSGLVLHLLPQETASLHLFSQGRVTQKSGGQAMSPWPCGLRAPTCPWADSSAPRDQAQPSSASATTRWYGQLPWESSSFSKVCLLYKHNRKIRAKRRRWWGQSKSGERRRSWRWPAAPSPAPAVSVEEDGPCVPSCCQASQTILSSNFTWLEPSRERVRGGGGSQRIRSTSPSLWLQGLAGLRKITRLPPPCHLIHKIHCLGT